MEKQKQIEKTLREAKALLERIQTYGVPRDGTVGNLVSKIANVLGGYK